MEISTKGVTGIRAYLKVSESIMSPVAGHLSGDEGRIVLQAVIATEDGLKEATRTTTVCFIRSLHARAMTIISNVHIEH